MFFNKELFIKKGILAKIWLAGTVFQKVSKKAILDSDILELCDQVENCSIPLAISTFGILTLGIVRIHRKSIHYLLLTATETQSRLNRIYLNKNTNINLASTNAIGNEITIDVRQRMEDGSAEPSLEELAEVDVQLMIYSDIAEDIEGEDEEDEKHSEFLVPEHAISLPAHELLNGDFQNSIQFDDELLNNLEIGIDFDDENENELLFNDMKEEDEQPMDITPEPIGIDAVSSAISIPSNQELLKNTMIENTPELNVSQIVKKRKRKRRKMLRFESIADGLTIEMKRNEALINENNIHEHTLPRPQFIHNDERHLHINQYLQWMNTSLSGVYAHSKPAEIYSNLWQNMGRNVSSFEKQRAIQEQQKEEGRIGRSVDLQLIEEEDDIPFFDNNNDDQLFNNNSNSSIIHPLEKQLSFDRFSNESSTSNFLGKNLDAYYAYDDGHIGSATPPALKRRRLDSVAIHSSDDRRRIFNEFPETSSEEMTVPQEISKLSHVFKGLIGKGLEDALDVTEQDIGICVALEELLVLNAKANDSRLSSRDVARAFMQTLILKNEDIIDVQQQFSYEPIFIAKGPKFDEF